jgi:hypothetical protein
VPFSTLTSPLSASSLRFPPSRTIDFAFLYRTYSTHMHIYIYTTFLVLVISDLITSYQVATFLLWLSFSLELFRCVGRRHISSLSAFVLETAIPVTFFSTPCGPPLFFFLVSLAAVLLF